MTSREELIARAKMAEQAQRFEEMSMAMKKVVELDSGLSDDERNLLSIAYKQVSGTKRQSWRILSNIEQKAAQVGDDKVEIVKIYKEKVESEIETLCHEVIQLLDSLLPKSSSNTEVQVFYYKMKGDYYRYLTEIFSSPDKHKKYSFAAEKAYNTGITSATVKLTPAHPIRLGLALNYSVFLFEIKNNAREACDLAKGAFDDAIAQINMLEDSSYRDSTIIMQLLHDNLELWGSTYYRPVVDSEY